MSARLSRRTAPRHRVPPPQVGPDAAQEIGRLRAAIEDTAPQDADLVRQREEVDRFLFGQERRRDRWQPSRAWIAFRRRLRESSPDRVPFEWLVREFFALIHTAASWMESDAQDADRRRKAAKAMGSRRQLAKLEALGTEAAGTLATIRGDRERLDFLNTSVTGFAFDPFQDGREYRVIVTFGDLLPDLMKRGRSKLRPGSGRHAAAETARDELMRFLTSLDLSERAADTIVRNLLRWYVGHAVQPNTARIQRQRARRKRT